MTFQKMPIVAAEIQLVEAHGVPTVRDVDLGARLGMKRPDHIRKKVEANRQELESYGPLYSSDTMVQIGSSAHRQVTEYHLSEEQALVICQISRAPRAKEVRRELIQVFTAYRRGHLVPELTPSSVGGITKAVVNKALADAINDTLPVLIEARLAQDPRIAAVDAVPALQVVLDKKVAMKGRRRVVQKVSNALARFCEERPTYHVTRDWSGRRLFPRGAVNEWLATGGWGPIKELIDYMAGQKRLHLVPKG